MPTWEGGEYPPWGVSTHSPDTWNTLGCGEHAGGTHPTGMLSCCRSVRTRSQLSCFMLISDSEDECS